jgi:hypothetical protein
MLFKQSFSFLSPMDLHHFHQTCTFVHIFLFYKCLIYQLRCTMERENSWKNLGFFFIVNIHLDSLINTLVSNIYCNNIVKCLTSKQKKYSTFRTLSLYPLFHAPSLQVPPPSLHTKSAIVRRPLRTLKQEIGSFTILKFIHTKQHNTTNPFFINNIYQTKINRHIH